MQPGASNGYGPIQSALRGLTVIMACASVLLLTPQLDAMTAEYVRMWASQEYGPDLAQLFRIGWVLCLVGFIFYAAQLGFYTGATLFVSSAFFKFMPV